MKWNKSENLGQTVRNYKNNFNISYFVLIDYLYILVIIMNQEIIRVERCLLLLGLLLGKLVGDIYYLFGNFYIINILNEIIIRLFTHLCFHPNQVLLNK